MKIGVLGLQGAFVEHMDALHRLGVKASIVKKKEEIISLDGLIIPGGESTAIRRLIDTYGIMDNLKKFSREKKPIFGTCAGLILLANKIVGYQEPHIGVMDVLVERNSFGRQVDSFEADLDIAPLDQPFTGVFIRAPHILEAGPSVEILAKHNERIVAARQGHLLGTSFHPELSDDDRMLNYFVGMVEESLKNR